MTHQTPLVSIIIPTYNRAHLIEETLQSVLAQTYTNWECIVVDDGSADGTETLIRDYATKDARFQYYTRPDTHKPGGNGARNFGFEVSKGEFINWFDDDDVMLDNFIDVKMKAITSKVNFIIASGYLVDDNLDNRRQIELYQPHDLFQDYVLWKLRIVTGNVMFKRKFLLGKILFNEMLVRGQEAELFSRLFFKLPSSSYKIVSEPLFLYRQHSHTKTFESATYNEAFKESQTYIAIENLKRGIKGDNKIVVNYYTKGILGFYFRAIENNHKKNAQYILKNFVPLFKKVNGFDAILFQLLGHLFLVVNRGSYKVEQYLKNKYI